MAFLLLFVFKPWMWWAIGYLIVMVVLYFIQEKFIFKPEKLHRQFQFKFEIPFKEIFYATEPGVSINALHFYRKHPAGIILYFHGNTRSIKGWAKYARDFYRYNYDVVLVDYRGFGKSTGKRSEQAMFQDMQFIYNQLKATYGEEQLILYGRSMGSGFAAKLASDNHPRMLILDAPYYSFNKVVERFLPFLPIRFVLRFHLRTDIWIRKINCPIYILHGTKDWLIPISQSEALQQLQPGRTILIRIKDGGHNNLPSFPEYHNFIRDILLL